MQSLDTIQTKEKLNNVYAVDQKTPDGANHAYTIVSKDLDKVATILFKHNIQFQKGPRHEKDSKHGVIDSDLLEIVRHRLQGFQSGPYASEYNQKALEHIEAALHWMNKRIEDRIARNVLGTYEK